MKKELITKIKKLNTSSNNHRKIVKDHLTKLFNDVKESATLLNLLKEQKLSDQEIHEISNTIGIDLKRVTQSYNHLSNRNCLDKHFLEHMEILERTLKQQKVKQVKKSRSTITTVGDLCANVRSLKKTASNDELQIILAMINGLKDEL